MHPSVQSTEGGPILCLVATCGESLPSLNATAAERWIMVFVMSVMQITFQL